MITLYIICGIDRKTVEEYIGLLEKTFIIFRLPAFRSLKSQTSNLYKKNLIQYAQKLITDEMPCMRR